MEGVLLGRTLLGCSRGNRWQALRLGHPGPTFEEERHLRCEPLQISPAQSLITVESQGSVAVRSVAVVPIAWVLPLLGWWPWEGY